jgi:hypothetical protein
MNTLDSLRIQPAARRHAAGDLLSGFARIAP